MNATASNPRPSRTIDLAGSYDVDVSIDLDGATLTGEVTLAPRQYDGSLEAYGDCPDMWISGDLLAQLRQRDDAKDCYRAIESAAVEACHPPSSDYSIRAPGGAYRGSVVAFSRADAVAMVAREWFSGVAEHAERAVSPMPVPNHRKLAAGIYDQSGKRARGAGSV